MLFSRAKKEALAVQGMSCSHCEQTVVNGLQDLPGVKKVKADHEQNQVEIFYKGEPPDMEAVRKKIADLGYEVALA
jgi:copper chaperone CopZ